MVDSGKQSLAMQHQEAEFDGVEDPAEDYSHSSFSFTRLMLSGQTSCAQTGMSEKESVSTEIFRERHPLSNMNLSLLPSGEASELFCNTRPQMSPYSGVCANVSAFGQIKQQQQQYSQLTIFYGGKVNVYNVTSEKAKAIMALANSGANPTTPPPVNSTPNSTAEIMCSTPTHASPFTIEHRKLNLPVCQKYSLQRFLEKRSGRLQARASSANNPRALLHRN